MQSSKIVIGGTAPLVPSNSAEKQHGRFSHLRNMRILCKPFALNGSCDVVDCPFSHKRGELRIPGEQCRFEVCKMTNCDYFHGTASQWESLKKWRDTTVPTPSTYLVSAYLELKDPHVEAERTPAPTGMELIAGVRHHLMGNTPSSDVKPAPTGGGRQTPSPPAPTLTSPLTPLSNTGFLVPPSTASVQMMPRAGFSQLPAAAAGPGIHHQVPPSSLPTTGVNPAVQAPPQVMQAPRVTMLTAANGALLAWYCGQCNTQNTMDRTVCSHCELPPPWSCQTCQTANYGSRKTCVVCRALHPQYTYQQQPQFIQAPPQGMSVQYQPTMQYLPFPPTKN